jgi:SAM-dependent methyltransferase
VFLERPAVPVHQNAICADRRSALTMPRGDLRLVICSDCGFVFNAAFDAARLSYGPDYENSQYASPAFREYTDGLVRHVVQGIAGRPARVVEVGCGNGRFLTAVVEKAPAAVGTGFDPSYRGPDTALDGRVRFERRFFSDDPPIEADVVICRHVIEHIPEPLEILRAARSALAESGGTAYFETPSIEWIFERRAFWDFFYEHCSYFTPASLRYAFAQASLDVDDVQTVFGGQYLWLDARPSAVPPRPARPAPALTREALAFGADDAALVQKCRTRIESLACDGAVALWGAGAKGVTLANLLDPDATLLACVVDQNPRKQGNFLPGTGHPIVSPRALPEHGVATAVIMNPNYRHELESLLRNDAIDVRLVDLEPA